MVIQDGALWDEVLSWAGMLSETGCYPVSTVRRGYLPVRMARMSDSLLRGLEGGEVVDVEVEDFVADLREDGVVELEEAELHAGG